MYEEGLPDTVIADYFRIPTGTVTSYRRKHWEKEDMAAGKGPKETPPKERFSLKGMEPVPPATIQDTGAGEGRQDPKEETQEDQMNFNFAAGLQEPSDPSAAAEPAPEGEKETVKKPPSLGTWKKPDIMDVLEMATGHLAGMQAVCTAGAVYHLMHWRYREDLLHAREHIDHLLHMLDEKGV